MASSRWSHAHLVRVLTAGTALLFPATARADVERIALHYEAAGACPSDAELVAWVEAHTRRWTRVPDESTGVRSIRVRVEAGEPEATGSIHVRSIDGAVTERTIHGPTCADVSEALAVMVAVAIDPAAGSAEAREEVVEKSPSAPDEVRPVPITPPQRMDKPPGPARPRFSFDLRLETTSAVLRGALPGVGASITLDPMPSPRRGTPVFDPSIAVGVRQSLLLERALQNGSAEFSWTAGQLRLCPFRIVLENVVEASPCVESNVGVLRASARGFADARGTSTPWLDVGGSLLTTVSLSETLFLSSTVVVAMPFYRQPFALASGATVASVPPLGVLGGLGLGLRL
jgi:hypothetical protein